MVDKVKFLHFMRCSFCGLTKAQVEKRGGKLIVGGGGPVGSPHERVVYICSACAKVAGETVRR